MGGEEATTEVGEAVGNGNVGPTKPDNVVSEKKDVGKGGVEEMCEDDEKDQNKEVSKDAKEEEEEKEINDSKEEGKDKMKEEMEAEDEENADEQSENKKADVGGDIIKEEEMKVVGSKKHATKKGTGGEKGNKKKKDTEEKKGKEEAKTPVAPRTIDRPVRERKSVERLVAVIEKDTSREFHIEKGRGTAFKDIPNVAYKLSKKKVSDDALKLLHTVLFGRRGKALLFKSNILQFSGFVWHENEEKQKAKVQEKLEKCNKEKLFELCDLVDIPIAKATAKKEDVVAKLIDFLLLPHITTRELLSEKEQQSSKGSKRKRPSKKSASTCGVTPSKKQKSKSASEEREGTRESEEESNEHERVNGGPEKSCDSEGGHVSESESGDDESKKKRKRGGSASKNKSKPDSKSKDQSAPTPKTFSTFSRKKKPCSPKKSAASKEKTGKKAAKEQEKPSDDELKAATCEILKQVDFNTATFTDILKLLAKRFDTDLTPRKATIKLMIQDELTRLAEDVTDDNEEEA